MRDDFTRATKIQLAKRVGYLCSYPGCGSLTIGPSDESEQSTSSVGIACHISSAAGGKGSRRFNPNMTSKERKHISNGIWMCEKHGKLIDTDENRFSSALLINWKKLAESVAKSMVQKGYDYETALRLLDGKKLADNAISIEQIGRENEAIGNLIDDSCIDIVWGKEISEALRDFIIEHLRNSFDHGKATKFDVKIEDNKINLADNGLEFNPQGLLNNQTKTGGTISIQNLIVGFSDRIVFSSRRSGNLNLVTITILRKAKDIIDATPCSLQLTFEDFHEGNSFINVSELCNEVYMVLPPYFALSDVRFMRLRFPQFNTISKPIIFVGEHISNGVKILLKENYPDCRIIVMT